MAKESTPTYEAIMAEMMEFIKRQEWQIARQGETINELRQGGERHETDIVTDDMAVVRFLKFLPPTFGGTRNEEDAEKWLENMVKIFAPLHYNEERKIQFSVFLLEGSAEAWWRVIKQKWEQTGVPQTWDAFQNEFKAKFIPQVIRDKRGEEFMYLKQRALTVSQYETNFTRLAKYAPELVDTEEKRRRKFVRGLNVEIQNALITARVTTYAEAVDLAQKIEDGQARLREAHNNRRMATYNVPAAGGVTRPVTAKKGPGGKQETPSVVCQFCGKHTHTEEECWRKARICFRCGSRNHKINNCPQTTAKKAKVSAGV